MVRGCRWSNLQAAEAKVAAAVETKYKKHPTHYAANIFITLRLSRQRHRQQKQQPPPAPPILETTLHWQLPLGPQKRVWRGKQERFVVAIATRAELLIQGLPCPVSSVPCPVSSVLYEVSVLCVLCPVCCVPWHAFLVFWVSNPCVLCPCVLCAVQ